MFRNSFILSGERGIRTPGTVARTPHFECGPFDHSGISPNLSGCKYSSFYLFYTPYPRKLSFFFEKRQLSAHYLYICINSDILMSLQNTFFI